MTNAADDPQTALIRARCTLGIVHAQYRRALERAQACHDSDERKREIAEAHCLIDVAANLRKQIAAMGPERERAAVAEPAHPAVDHPASGKPRPLRAA